MSHFSFNHNILIADLAIIYSAFRLGWILSRRKYTGFEYLAKVESQRLKCDLKGENEAYKLLVRK